MSGDIYSVSFFKYMGLAKADLNSDGKIKGQDEQNIYTEYMKNFEKDGKKGLSKADVELFKKSLEGTEPKGVYFSDYDKPIENIGDFERHSYLTLSYFLSNQRIDDFNIFIDSYKKNFMNEENR